MFLSVTIIFLGKYNWKIIPVDLQEKILVLLFPFLQLGASSVSLSTQ